MAKKKTGDRVVELNADDGAIANAREGESLEEVAARAASDGFTRFVHGDKIWRVRIQVEAIGEIVDVQ